MKENKYTTDFYWLRLSESQCALAMELEVAYLSPSYEGEDAPDNAKRMQGGNADEFRGR